MIIIPISKTLDILKYSAIKKNTFESVLMRWMKLEPIIQSEVSFTNAYIWNLER